MAKHGAYAAGWRSTRARQVDDQGRLDARRAADVTRPTGGDAATFATTRRRPGPSARLWTAGTVTEPVEGQKIADPDAAGGHPGGRGFSGRNRGQHRSSCRSARSPSGRRRTMSSTSAGIVRGTPRRSSPGRPGCATRSTSSRPACASTSRCTASSTRTLRSCTRTRRSTANPIDRSRWPCRAAQPHRPAGPLLAAPARRVGGRPGWSTSSATAAVAATRTSPDVEQTLPDPG